jgi:ribosomal 30S subunit maturation factor RimM
MSLDDLVSIGNIGNSNAAPKGFLKFKPNWNFQSFLLDITDIFLVFPDHRVRFVTIEEIQKGKFLWIKLREKEVYQELAEFRDVQYRLPKADLNLARYLHDENFLNDMKVVYQNESLGRIVQTMNNGAHNTIEVLLPSGKEVLIPQVDRYILSIDKDKHCVVVQNIDELLKL